MQNHCNFLFLDTQIDDGVKQKLNDKYVDSVQLGSKISAVSNESVKVGDKKTSTLTNPKSTKLKLQTQQPASKPSEKHDSQARAGTLKWGKIVSPKIEDELTAGLTFSVDTRELPIEDAMQADIATSKDIISPNTTNEKPLDSNYSDVKREKKTKKTSNNSKSSEVFLLEKNSSENSRSDKVITTTKKSKSSLQKQSNTKTATTATNKNGTLEKRSKSHAKTSKSASKGLVWISPKT